MFSLTEENYLKAIYHLSQEPGNVESESVQTNDLADAMSNKAASATDMIKKLAGKGLITYEKYHGVHLTNAGRTAALHVIRKHRLWETFLVQKLGFQWDEVHEIAEQLEHIQSPQLIDKLDEFLGFPKMDPHGDFIPDSKGRIKIQPQVPLEQLKAGEQGTIRSVKDSDSQLLKYLDKIGAHPGNKIKVLSQEAYDGSMEVYLSYKRVFISKEVSQNIMVAV
jgi:DtxR family Mn-dependent transcriptional regulator